jgi:hypothetical protein
VVVVGDQIVNSDASSAINVDGSGTEATCAGQWFTYANETTPPALASYSHSTSSFAPVGCGPATSKDNPTRFTPNFPRVDDPYAGSSTPAGNMSTNCQPCGTTGWAYHWSSLLGRAAGTWVQASALPSSITSDNWEFFPGIYPNGLDVEQGVGNLYFNPGVYTMQSDLKIKAGTVCLYGSPACAPALGNLIPGLTGVACWNASFNQLDPVYVLSSIWYHLCSPYGVWDATLPRTGGQGPATAPPTFVGSSRPLNGLTFYLQSGTFDMETPSGGYLAAPNPCPGTGNDTLLPVVSDDFLAGSDSSTSSYIYLPTSAAGQDAVLFGGPLSSPPRQLYPNVDFSTSEDKVCNATSGLGNVWQGEFAGNVVSHLHFLVFQRDPGHGIKLTTSGQQYWWGILYNPGNYASGGGCASSCAVTIAGKASSAVIVPAGVNSGVTTCNLGLTCGPPAVFGQIVADNLSYSGNVGVEVYYRPSSSVGSGPGTALVQ